MDDWISDQAYEQFLSLFVEMIMISASLLPFSHTKQWTYVLTECNMLSQWVEANWFVIPIFKENEDGSLVLCIVSM